MRIASSLIVSFALLMSGQSHAVEMQPYTASYDFSRNGGQVGIATVSVEKTANGWSYDSQTTPTSLAARIAAIDVNEHSDLRVNGGALETRSYRYRQSSIAKTRTRSIDVDAASGRIVAADKKGEQNYPYQPGVLDRQSVTLGIAQDLANGKRGILSYKIANSDRVDVERYRVGKQETLDVPAGSMRTIVVTRIRDSSGGRVTASWFGIDNGFVPVRIVQTEPKCDVYEMRLISLKK